ncbi:MAG: PfkB family carbohydrate kinase [Acidimicrobiia bacterium]|nr:PfkB family carbohydrate kinase [Acidimicrobiia bacterium]
MDTPKIVCFGAAHIDRRAHSIAPIAPGTSNPVHVTESPGGVARNVAEVLARLGDEVALISVLGRDKHGQTVASQATEAGIDLTGMIRSDDLPTATYNALVEPDGHLYVGFADMAIYATLTPEVLKEAAAEHAKADAWFIDTNLAPESVTWLAARSPGLLAGNTVSVPKASRLRSVLGRLDLLVANKEEATVLLPDADGVTETALGLHAAGAKVVAITTHEQGVVIVADGEATTLGALDADARDVTGAGDAFTATMLHALLRGRDAVTAAHVALGAAAITVEADASVAEELTERSARARAGLPIES